MNKSLINVSEAIKNKYTSDDVTALKKCFEINCKPVESIFPDAFFEPDDKNYHKGMGMAINWVTYPNLYLIKFVLNFKNKYLYGTDDIDYYFLFAFIFFIPIEEVPLYTNNMFLNKYGFIQWRLQIGK